MLPIRDTKIGPIMLCRVLAAGYSWVWYNTDQNSADPYQARIVRGPANHGPFSGSTIVSIRMGGILSFAERVRDAEQSCEL